MAVSFRVPGKHKLKRSNYKKGQPKNREWCHDLQEFTFDEDNDYSDDEISFSSAGESVELRKRNAQNDKVVIDQQKSHLHHGKHLINYEVKASDTLQSISLQFGCQVAEIKQANKFITDQDFYAHRSIQIPVSEHGCLSENLVEVKEEDSHTTQHTDSNVVNLSIGQMLANNSSVVSQSFLQAMDKDIQHIVETTQSQVHAAPEVLRLPRFYTMANPQVTGCDGSNWGLNWWCLLIVIVIIGVVSPILYVLYQAS